MISTDVCSSSTSVGFIARGTFVLQNKFAKIGKILHQNLGFYLMGCSRWCDALDDTLSAFHLY